MSTFSGKDVEAGLYRLAALLDVSRPPDRPMIDCLESAMESVGIDPSTFTYLIAQFSSMGANYYGGDLDDDRTASYFVGATHGFLTAMFTARDANG